MLRSLVASTISGSDVCNCHFRRPLRCLVLAGSRVPSCQLTMIDDPPDRSVSPASSTEGASTVTFGGLPLRPSPSPSHDIPCTSFSKEKSVLWSRGSVRTVRAICRPDCVESSAPEAPCPNRCHPCRSFCFGSCGWCEAVGYGTSQVQRLGEAQKCTRCYTRLDTM